MYFLPKKMLIKPSSISTKGVLIACSLFSPMALAVCITTALSITPSSNFTDHNDGTVTHKSTGLMWKVCSEGQTWVAGSGGGMASCSDTPTTYAWNLALQVPQVLNSGGGFPLSGGSANYTNWRLPNLKELKSIVELRCYTPAINETIFPNTASYWYWSSSPSAVGSDSAWAVSFDYGDRDYGSRDGSVQVRLVRSGQ